MMKSKGNTLKGAEDEIIQLEVENYWRENKIEQENYFEKTTINLENNESNTKND